MGVGVGVGVCVSVGQFNLYWELYIHNHLKASVSVGYVWSCKGEASKLTV